MPPSLLKALSGALDKFLYSLLTQQVASPIQVAKKTISNKPVEKHIRKRHWVLGSAVVFFGSWITHTTTATIAIDPVSPRQTNQTAASVALGSTESLQIQPFTFTALPAEQTPVAKIEIQSPKTTPVFASEKSHKVRRGESLGAIFRKLDLGHRIPHFISQHADAKRLTSLSVGKELRFRFDDQDNLIQIRYPESGLTDFVVQLDGETIVETGSQDHAFETVEHRVSGEITTSLYQAARKAGLSSNMVMEMAQVFGWDIDFAQDIRAGDSFHLVYTDFRIGDKKLADGDILAAEFTTQGHTYRAIRFESPNGGVSYYSPEGESMLGTFLRSPVEFSYISSRFGRRIHPISKKWKAHKGVDYAASRGTPIRATADGKVIHAGRKGGYGKTIILRHAGRFSTLYAHMNGFAKNIKSGSRVKQGQIIGYVGSTGMSTGPHLHYEFRVDGTHQNPLTYKTPKASSVAEEEKAAFYALAQQQMAKLDSVRAQYANVKSTGSATGQ